MKMFIEKSTRAVLDTGLERKRIKKAFKKDPKLLSKLNEFMDSIEAQDWEKAGKIIEDPFWMKRDNEFECPNAEFVGLVSYEKDDDGFDKNDGFDNMMDYRDLAWGFARTSRYKVLEIIEEPNKKTKKTKKTKKKGKKNV